MACFFCGTILRPGNPHFNIVGYEICVGCYDKHGKSALSYRIHKHETKKAERRARVLRRGLEIANVS